MSQKMDQQKSIDTPYLKISGNCLEFTDTCIQLSNISLFTTVDVNPAKFPLYSLIFILAGLIMIEHQVVIALLLLAAGGAIIAYWYLSVQKVKEQKRLIIVTNSGNTFPILFSNQQFLNRVLVVMRDIIREPNNQGNMLIDIKNCTFNGQSGVVTNNR